MKIGYIILIFAVVIGSFFGLQDCVHEHYLESEQKTFNPLSYIFARSEWSSFSKNDKMQIDEYQFSVKKLKLMQNCQDNIKQLYKNWYALRDTVNAFVPKREIVYVKRIALSPDMVMMSPSTYQEHYAGNHISASGQGADKERIHIFYLSDGKIIKATARTNSEWLAVSVGQKVEKSQVMKIKKAGSYGIQWYPLDSKVAYERYRRYVEKRYTRDAITWHAPTMETVVDVNYKPIFFN